MIKHITVATSGQGLHEFTPEVEAAVRGAGIEEGLCTLFIRHTSASLLIQENADPCVERDLGNWFNRLVKENDPLYTHQTEGPDDMPGHIKAALTASTLSIPVGGGRLLLGTWRRTGTCECRESQDGGSGQGIFLWEHRHRGGKREVVIHIGS